MKKQAIESVEVRVGAKEGESSQRGSFALSFATYWFDVSAKLLFSLLNNFPLRLFYAVYGESLKLAASTSCILEKRPMLALNFFTVHLLFVIEKKNAGLKVAENYGSCLIAAPVLKLNTKQRSQNLWRGPSPFAFNIYSHCTKKKVCIFSTVPVL